MNTVKVPPLSRFLNEHRKNIVCILFILNWCSEGFSKQEMENITFFKLKLEKTKYSHVTYFKQCQNDSFFFLSVKWRLGENLVT